MADRYDLDPTLVRLMWVVFCTVTLGVGSIVYAVMAALTPSGPSQAQAAERTGTKSLAPPEDSAVDEGSSPARSQTAPGTSIARCGHGMWSGSAVVVGGLLVALGAVALLANFEVFGAWGAVAAVAADVGRTWIGFPA